MYTFMCISFSLTWLSIFATVATQTCYFPDGSIDSASTPCNGEGSWCCPFGFFCESNLLCGVGIQYLVFTDEAYQRYSCADQTWQSNQCPGVCRGINPSGAVAILACDNGQYCCQEGLGDPSCCNPSGTFFSLSLGATQVTTIGVTPQTNTVTNTVTITSITTLVSTQTQTVTQTVTQTTASPSTATTTFNSIMTAATGATAMTIFQSGSTSTVSVTVTVTATAGVVCSSTATPNSGAERRFGWIPIGMWADARL